jgi:hypothetical protein
LSTVNGFIAAYGATGFVHHVRPVFNTNLLILDDESISGFPESHSSVCNPTCMVLVPSHSQGPMGQLFNDNPAKIVSAERRSTCKQPRDHRVIQISWLRLQPMQPGQFSGANRNLYDDIGWDSTICSPLCAARCGTASLPISFEPNDILQSAIARLCEMWQEARGKISMIVIRRVGH